MMGSCFNNRRMLLRLIGSLLCLLTFATLASAFVAPDANAQEETEDEVVIFVLDLSGSMNEPFDAGRTKLDAAKAAFVEAFANVSSNALVGLRTYGDLIPATTPEAREPSCTQDTRLVTPVAQLERSELIRQVQGFTALGDTPIGLALERAGQDIPEGATGTIVLFSDGRDECFDADLDGDPLVGPSFGNDPCATAREVASSASVSRIVTVGFSTDAVAEAELRCIAEATGGAYTSIETSEDARDVLPELLVELSAPREAERLVGREIAGTPTREDAPELLRLDAVNAEQVLYTDTIDMGSERWYHVESYGPEGGTFTATVFGLPPEADIEFDMAVVVPKLNRRFFTDHGEPNAGLPARPSASIRCTDCLISNGPYEVFFVVSLKATSGTSLRGTYELEVVTAGPGFGGPSISCTEPQECWYPQAINDRRTAIAAAKSEIDSFTGTEASDALIAKRDDLAEDTVESQEAVTAAQVRLEELNEILTTAPEPGVSWRLPLFMLLGGVGLGLAPLGKLKRKPKEPSDDEQPLESTAEQDPVRAQAPDVSVAAQESSVVVENEVVGPPGVSLPLTPTPPAKPGKHKWDAELEAAKEALAQQRPANPTVDEVPVETGPFIPTVSFETADTGASEPDAAASAPIALGASTEPAGGAFTPEQHAAAKAEAERRVAAAAAAAAAEEQVAAPAEAAPPPTAGPPPGWYKDPAAEAEFRWWDGTTWTVNTSADGQGTP